MEEGVVCSVSHLCLLCGLCHHRKGQPLICIPGVTHLNWPAVCVCVCFKLHKTVLCRFCVCGLAAMAAVSSLKCKNYYETSWVDIKMHRQCDVLHANIQPHCLRHIYVPLSYIFFFTFDIFYCFLYYTLHKFLQSTFISWNANVKRTTSHPLLLHLNQWLPLATVSHHQSCQKKESRLCCQAQTSTAVVLKMLCHPLFNILILYMPYLKVSITLESLSKSLCCESLVFKCRLVFFKWCHSAGNMHVKACAVKDCKM